MTATAATPPRAEVAGAQAGLLRRHFLNREDRLCFLASWCAPCPCQVEGEAHLEALLLAHLMGPDAEECHYPWRSARKKTSGVDHGHRRLGAYTPGRAGLTKWLCIDFDAGGDEHSAPLAAPLAAALSVLFTLSRLGLPAYLERSGGGKGWHVWLLVEPAIPATQARPLGFAMLPRCAMLTDGGLADPHGAKGIEVFPTADRLKGSAGVGNQVWLPWWHGAKPGGSQFYATTAGGLRQFIPEEIEVADEAAVTRAVRQLEGGASIRGWSVNVLTTGRAPAPGFRPLLGGRRVRLLRGHLPSLAPAGDGVRSAGGGGSAFRGGGDDRAGRLIRSHRTRAPAGDPSPSGGPRLQDRGGHVHVVLLAQDPSIALPMTAERLHGDRDEKPAGSPAVPERSRADSW